MSDLPIACTLSGVARQERGEKLARILARVEESRRLDEGLALRFPGGDPVLEELSELIRLERQCCAFLTFRLTVEPGGGPIWLELSGPSGTGAFLEAELGMYL
jgi:hypothetical protein